jgi:hypothetical protein
MGSTPSMEESQAAARGSQKEQAHEGGHAPGAGPEEFPRNEEFREGGAAGNVFGDRKSRKPPGEGADLVCGLSCRIGFGTGNDPDREEEACDKLGEGRDESTGKPTGPQKGPADNGGASAKVQWG